MRTADPKSPTKEKIVKSAVKLMRAKGYEATSVDDICCDARLTKGSFFHYFKDKESLAKAALDDFCCCQADDMGKARKEGKDPLKKLDSFIDRIIEMGSEHGAIHGCLIGNFSQELSDTHPELRKACAEKFEGFGRFIKTLLDAARSPKVKADTGSLAEHFLSVMQGSFILAKAKQDIGVFKKNMEHLRRYLRSALSG